MWSLLLPLCFGVFIFFLHAGVDVSGAEQVQSVIQPTSVIQSTPSLQTTSLSKGNIVLVSKPNSVIHTTGGGAIQTLQVIRNAESIPIQTAH